LSQEPSAAPDIGPARSLLAEDEPAPVTTDRPNGTSRLFLACDHAGRRVPRALGRLGLPEEAFERHIAWDIGIEAVSLALSAALDATLVRQAYSRLVIDCNRPGGVASSIPVISEATAIPGNVGISAAEAEARRREIFAPYHDRLRAALDQRAAAGRPTILIAMHSFTPVYHGVARPWHIGTLYGRDARLATILRDLLRAEGDLVVGDNEPYSVSDATDYTIPVHGEARGLPHVGIEIRQDHITDPAGQAEWAERLGRLLPRAAALLNEGQSPT
jgi:predicted N-formylglutamate amidohydrolase